jgi:hypothetical protein
MKLNKEYRARAAMCRQGARREPKNAIHWLAESARWERLAEDEMSACFVEGNAASSRELGNINRR